MMEVLFHHAIGCIGDGVSASIDSGFDGFVSFTTRCDDWEVRILFTNSFDEFDCVFTSADVDDVYTGIDVRL